MIVITLLSFAGLIISAYAYFIEQKLKKDVQYKPVCDLSEGMSCTKPIMSKYAKLFGISNALLGIIFYALLLLFAFLGFKNLLFFASIVAVIGSIVFASILYFKIKTFCLLCSSIYVINILLLIATYRNW